MSELGVPGKSGATVISGWWIVSGILTIGLGMSLHLGTSKESFKLDLVGPCLIALYGLFVGIGSGVFPCDEGCAGKNLSGRLHDTLNAIGAMAQLVAPGACFLRWRRAEKWWGYRIWTIGAQVALLVTFALFMAFAEASHDQGVESLKGLYQRLYQGTYYVWLAVVAVRSVQVRGSF